MADFGAQLPVNKYKESIIHAMDTSPVSFIQGETGSGKSTQVPQIILDHYKEIGTEQGINIVITQPRRIAAIQLAKRVAAERGCVLGTTVGYSVGGDSQVQTLDPNSRTRIRFVTTGWLLANLHRHPTNIFRYTHIILDELHERSSENDLLCLLIKLILICTPVRETEYMRPKLICMSATLQVEVFQKYFAVLNQDCLVRYRSPKLRANHFANISGQVNQTYRPSDIIYHGSAPLTEIPVKTFHVMDIFLTEFFRSDVDTQILKDIPRDVAHRELEKRGIFSETELQILANYSAQFLPTARRYLCDGNKAGLSQRIQTQTPCLKYSDMRPIIARLCQKFARPETTCLVFLPGLHEIYEVYRDLQKILEALPMSDPNIKWALYAIHSQIPWDDQQEAFHPVARDTINVVLASNIAESSVTLPRVKLVVDYCTRKHSVFNDQVRTSILSLKWCSQASLKQRRGRAGREMKGYCFRLIPEWFVGLLGQFDQAETQVGSLDTLYLRARLLADGFQEVLEKKLLTPPFFQQKTENGAQFTPIFHVPNQNDVFDILAPMSPSILLRQLVEPPSIDRIQLVRILLFDMGALSSVQPSAHLTTIGKLATILPLNLMQVRVIYYGILMNCLADAVILALCCPRNTDCFHLTSRFKREANEREYIRKSTDDANSRLYCDHGENSEIVARSVLFNNFWLLYRETLCTGNHTKLLEDLPREVIADTKEKDKQFQAVQLHTPIPSEDFSRPDKQDVRHNFLNSKVCWNWSMSKKKFIPFLFEVSDICRRLSESASQSGAADDGTPPLIGMTSQCYAQVNALRTTLDNPNPSRQQLVIMEHYFPKIHKNTKRVEFTTQIQVSVKDMLSLWHREDFVWVSKLCLHAAFINTMLIGRLDISQRFLNYVGGCQGSRRRCLLHKKEDTEYLDSQLEFPQKTSNVRPFKKERPVLGAMTSRAKYSDFVEELIVPTLFQKMKINRNRRHPERSVAEKQVSDLIFARFEDKTSEQTPCLQNCLTFKLTTKDWLADSESRAVLAGMLQCFLGDKIGFNAIPNHSGQRALLTFESNRSGAKGDRLDLKLLNMAMFTEENQGIEIPQCIDPDSVVFGLFHHPCLVKWEALRFPVLAADELSGASLVGSKTNPADRVNLNPRFGESFMTRIPDQLNGLMNDAPSQSVYYEASRFMKVGHTDPNFKNKCFDAFYTRLIWAIKQWKQTGRLIPQCVAYFSSPEFLPDQGTGLEEMDDKELLSFVNGESKVSKGLPFREIQGSWVFAESWRDESVRASGAAGLSWSLDSKQKWVHLTLEGSATKICILLEWLRHWIWTDEFPANLLVETHFNNLCIGVAFSTSLRRDKSKGFFAVDGFCALANDNCGVDSLITQLVFMPLTSTVKFRIEVRSGILRVTRVHFSGATKFKVPPHLGLSLIVFQRINRLRRMISRAVYESYSNQKLDQEESLEIKGRNGQNLMVSREILQSKFPLPMGSSRFALMGNMVWQAYAISDPIWERIEKCQAEDANASQSLENWQAVQASLEYSHLHNWVQIKGTDENCLGPPQDKWIFFRTESHLQTSEGCGLWEPWEATGDFQCCIGFPVTSSETKTKGTIHTEPIFLRAIKLDSVGRAKSMTNLGDILILASTAQGFCFFYPQQKAVPLAWQSNWPDENVETESTHNNGPLPDLSDLNLDREIRNLLRKAQDGRGSRKISLQVWRHWQLKGFRLTASHPAVHSRSHLPAFDLMGAIQTSTPLLFDLLEMHRDFESVYEESQVYWHPEVDRTFSALDRERWLLEKKMSQKTDLWGVLHYCLWFSFYVPASKNVNYFPDSHSVPFRSTSVKRLTTHLEHDLLAKAYFYRLNLPGILCVRGQIQIETSFFLENPAFHHVFDFHTNTQGELVLVLQARFLLKAPNDGHLLGVGPEHLYYNKEKLHELGLHEMVQFVQWEASCFAHHCRQCPELGDLLHELGPGPHGQVLPRLQFWEPQSCQYYCRLRIFGHHSVIGSYSRKLANKTETRQVRDMIGGPADSRMGALSAAVTNWVDFWGAASGSAKGSNCMNARPPAQMFELIPSCP